MDIKKNGKDQLDNEDELKVDEGKQILNAIWQWKHSQKGHN